MKFERFHAPLAALVVGFILMAVNFPYDAVGGNRLSSIAPTYSGYFFASCLFAVGSLIWFCFIGFGSKPKGAKRKSHSSRSRGLKQKKRKKRKKR
jgi:hypothetical protein